MLVSSTSPWLELIVTAALRPLIVHIPVIGMHLNGAVAGNAMLISATWLSFDGMCTVTYVAARRNQRFQRVNFALRFTIRTAIYRLVERQMHLVVVAGGHDDIAVRILNLNGRIGRQRMDDLLLGFMFVSEHLGEIHVVAKLQLFPNGLPIDVVMRGDNPQPSPAE